MEEKFSGAKELSSLPVSGRDSLLMMTDSDSFLRGIRKCPSPNCDERPAGVMIDTVVLHATVLDSLDQVIKLFTDPASKVSSHYTIDRDGTMVAHVGEDRRAWHAGQSRMKDGRWSVND